MARFLLPVVALAATLSTSLAYRDSSKNGKKKLRPDKCRVNASSSLVELTASGGAAATAAAAAARGRLLLLGGFLGRDPKVLIREFLKNGHSKVDCGLDVDLLNGKKKKGAQSGLAHFTDQLWKDEVLSTIANRIEQLRQKKENLQKKLYATQNDVSAHENEKPQVFPQGNYAKIIKDVMVDDKDCAEKDTSQNLQDKVDAITDKIVRNIEELGGSDKVVFYGEDFLVKFNDWLDKSNATDACMYIRSNVYVFITTKLTRSAWANQQKALEDQLQEISVQLEPAQYDHTTCIDLAENLHEFHVQLQMLRQEKISSMSVKAKAKRANTAAQLAVKEINKELTVQLKLQADLEKWLLKRGLKAGMLTKLLAEQKKKEEEMSKNTIAAEHALQRAQELILRSSTAFTQADAFKTILTEFVQAAITAHDTILQFPLVQNLGLEFRHNLDMLLDDKSGTDAHAAIRNRLEGLKGFCDTDLGALEAVEVEECGVSATGMCSEKHIMNPDATLRNIDVWTGGKQTAAKQDLQHLLTLVPETAIGLDDPWMNTQEPAGARKFELIFGESTFFVNYLKGWMFHKVNEDYHPRVLLKLWIHLQDMQEDQKLQREAHSKTFTALQDALKKESEASNKFQGELDKAMDQLKLSTKNKTEADKLLEEMRDKQKKRLKDAEDFEIKLTTAENKLSEAMNMYNETLNFMSESLLALGFTSEGVRRSFLEESAASTAGLDGVVQVQIGSGGSQMMVEASDSASGTDADIHVHAADASDSAIGTDADIHAHGA